LDSARAEPQARIERDGSTFRVAVTKSDGRPGITFPAPAGGWSLSGLSAIEAKVKNTGRHVLNVHLVIDGPGADRTHRKNCKISSQRLSPGEEKTLTVPIVSTPPSPVEWLQSGKAKTYRYLEVAEQDGYNLPVANVISIYVYHPGADYEYEVTGLRAGPDARPLNPGK
jgi:hypothetical protein